MSNFANKEYGFKFPLTNKYRCLNVNNIFTKDPLVNKCLGAKGKVGVYDQGNYERMPTIAMEKCFEEFEATNLLGWYKSSTFGYESLTYGSLGTKEKVIQPTTYPSTFTDQ